MSNIYLTSDAADTEVTAGTGRKWKAQQAANASARTIVKKCQNPHVSPLQMTDGTGTNDGTVCAWYSDPLQAVTITGTVTCSLWAFEGATAVNAAIAIQVQRCAGDGTVISTICANSVNETGGECPTTAGAYTATLPAASVTDTALTNGDRLRITAWMADASAQGGTGALTTATTRYAQMYINGATGGSGQSQLAFTESLSVYATTVGKDFVSPASGADTLLIAPVVHIPLADSGAAVAAVQAGAPQGLISGTPTGGAATYDFTVKVTDAKGVTATANLAITTQAATAGTGNAGTAGGAGQAPAPGVGVTVLAGAATGTGQAAQPVSGITAAAGQATGPGTATAPSPAITTPAGAAGGTGTSLTPAPAVTTAAGPAGSSGDAPQPSAAPAVTPPAATAAGAAPAPAPAPGTPAGQATASGQAPGPSRALGSGDLYAGAAAGVSGTWETPAAATGPATGDYATWTATGPGTATLELSGFGAQDAVPAGAALGDVTVTVRHGEDTPVTAMTAQACLGASPYGDPQPLTAAPGQHADQVTVTGLTRDDLADLRIRVTAARTG